LCVGGYDASVLDNPPSNGLLRFSLESFVTDFVPVVNHPVNGTTYFLIPPGTVLVPRERRIYFFGGMSLNATSGSVRYHDEIFFIDL
jgi:hypothetical protein